MRYLIILLFSSIIYSQGSGNIVNSLNVPTSVPNPTVLIGANPVPSGTWKVYLKDDIRWETYNINGFNSQVANITSALYKPLAYTPTASEISSALGYQPYSASNPNGYISSYTESDPIWSSVSNNYRTKTQNDLLYEPIFSKNSAFNKNFGTVAGTVVEGNDGRLANGQSAFNALPNYLLISTAASTYQPIGSYLTSETDPSVPSYSKSLTGFSVIKTSTDAIYEPIFTKNTGFNKNFGTILNTITEGNDPRVLNGQTAFSWGNHSTMGYVTSNSANTFTNKSGNISQWTNDSAYLTGITSTQINTALGYAPYNGAINPNGFLTSFTETDPTVPAYSKTLTAFSVIKSSTDPLYKSISYTPTSLEITSGLGFTPVPTTRTITINGVTSDLSANRTWTVGDLLSTGSYANPTWITSLAYNKLTGTPTIPTDNSQLANGNSYVNQAGVRTAISLTTTGSGGATYNNNTGVLNIPTISGGTVTSVTAGAGLSGGEITTSGTISLPNIGTPGTYNTVTTDTRGRVISGTVSTPTTVTIPLNTSSKISTTQATRVSYSVTHTIALTLVLSSGSSMAYLEISPDNSTWSTISQAGYSDGVAVAVALTKTVTNNIQGEVPANFFRRIRVVTSGAGSAAYTCGQETIF